MFGASSHSAQLHVTQGLVLVNLKFTEYSVYMAFEFGSEEGNWYVVVLHECIDRLKHETYIPVCYNVKD